MNPFPIQITKKDICNGLMAVDIFREIDGQKFTSETEFIPDVILNDDQIPNAESNKRIIDQKIISQLGLDKVVELAYEAGREAATTAMMGNDLPMEYYHG
jgi:hypothetical protein